MKRIGRAVGLVLAAALLLSGCELPEFLHMKGVDWKRLTRNTAEVQDVAPSPSPTPTPTEKPAPEGAAGQLWALVNALIANDATAVTAICPDGLPGYTTGATQSSVLLQQLYNAAYGSLSLRLGSVSEGNAAASVTAEFTARDMRSVLAAFRADAEAWCAGEGAAAGHDERMERYKSLLRARLAEEGESVTRRVSVALRREDGRWVVSADSELRSALTGGLTIALQDFDLPADPGDAPEQLGKDGPLYKSLMSNGYGSVAVSGVYPNAPEGYVVELTVSNSWGTALVFALRNTRLNGFVFDPGWSLTAAPGETLTTRLVWDRAALAKAGIAQVKNIRFRLEVFEKPAWPVYPLHSVNCTIYPSGGDDSVAAKPIVANEQPLYSDGVTYVSVLGTHSDGCWGYEMTLYLENNSDQELWFAFDDTRVDGQDADPGWSQTLLPGTRAVETVRWTAGELIARGIPEVERVDFRLSISTLVGLDESERSYSGGGRMAVAGDGTRLS